MIEPNLSQISKLLQALREYEISTTKLAKLLDRGIIFDIFEANPDKINRKELRIALGLESDPIDFLSVTVDYTRTISEMITTGRYDANSFDLFTSDRFEIIGSGLVSVKIVAVYIGEPATTSEVKRKLKSKNLRPAKLEELLAVGEQLPDMQKRFPIAALGTTGVLSNGTRVCGCIGHSSTDHRWLGAFNAEKTWEEYWRFAAVKI